MEDLISVIINVYNGEKYIKKCLESIINQTYKNLEILIINDGSTDNTISICESYDDERIRIINQKNMGLSLARNVGIENARGEYLYFIDCDDFVENDVVEYLYNLCKKYGALMATCNPYDIYSYNFVVKNKKEEIQILSNKEMLKKVLLSLDRAVTIWNKLIKKELFDNIKFEDRPINDVAVTYKLVLAADKIVYSNQAKYYYLRHSKSITATKKTDTYRAIDKYMVTVERYNYIKNIYPDLIENDIGLLRVIPILYIEGDSELCEYLEKEEALKLYKKLFSIKVFSCGIKLKEKLKLFLFRISPKLCKFVVNKYCSIKGIYKM